MLEGSHKTPGNKYTCAISIDIVIIYSEWGRKTFSLLMRWFRRKIIKKDWTTGIRQ